MKSIMLTKFKKVVAFLSVCALLLVYMPVSVIAAGDEGGDQVTIYHETFAEGAGAATQSGGAILTTVTDKVFDGNDDGAALHVSNRSDNWDAADFSFSALGLENGKTYSVTVVGYVDSDVTVPEGGQAFLQTVDSYGFINAANFIAGQPFSLKGNVTVNTDTDRAIRVQSSHEGASVPFYIGDILITGEETGSSEDPSMKEPTNTISVNNIPVVLYHRIVDSAPKTNNWTDTSLAKFKDHMDYLEENGYTTLSSAEYVKILKGEEIAPEKPILLTFDDATPDFITKALPILEEKGMKSVLFVISDWIGADYSMTEVQLKDIADNHPNVSIESHSKTHGDSVWVDSMTYQTALDELTATKTFLTEITGDAPVLLAYPYGRSSLGARVAAAETGIQYAFKVGYPNSGAYNMGRHYILDISVTEFAANIGGPVPPAGGEDESTPITVYSNDFEGESVTEFVQSGTAALSVSTDQKSEGAQSLKVVTSGGKSWDGAQISGTAAKLAIGRKYHISAQVYAPDKPVELVMQIVLTKAEDGSDDYKWLSNKAYTEGDTGWTTFEADLDLSTGIHSAIKNIQFAKGNVNNEENITFYVDDFTVTDIGGGSGAEEPEEPSEPRPPAIEFTTIDFEDETAGGFVGRAGTETLEVTDEANHTEGGSYALKVTGRKVTWHAPSLNVEKYIDQGSEYKITAWVKLIEPASSQLQLSTQVANGDGASYNNLQSKTITVEDGWVMFEGTYRYNNMASDYATIYIESASNATASFYIDDISFVASGAGPVDIDRDLTPIKDVYKNNFLIGNAISAEDLSGVRLELLKMHHNVATAGNAMKPEYLQPSKGVFAFDAADQIVDKVLAEGMLMHGHTLVWHSQSPDWMNKNNEGGYLGREEALENLRAHVKAVVEHYGEKVISWDVVNEAMNDNPSNPSDWKNALRKSPWFYAIGPDYLEEAFLAAREVIDENGWDIKLYYNDYNDDNQNKATAIYSMVKEINDRYAVEHPGELLIDGIGMQAHYNLSTNPDNVKLSLEKFISTGAEVSVTELDIMAGTNRQLSADQAKAQAYLYAQLFEIYKEHSEDIARVTFWGMDDATSWRSENNPLLFDKNLQAKPAFNAVIDPEKYIEDNPQEAPKDVNQSTAKYGTPTIDGVIDSVWDTAAAMPVNRYQMAWQGANGTAKALWDDNNLYVLVQINDSQLDKANANPWEQDSVEIFLDENNGKTTFYQEDDGQYRVNFLNEASFTSAAIAEGFVSATTTTAAASYVVEMKIPFKSITPGNNMKIGFDAQINDAKDGARISAATWNDLTGNGYQDTSVFGVLTLTGKGSGGSGGGGGTPVVTDPKTPSDDDTLTGDTPPANIANKPIKGTVKDTPKKALDSAENAFVKNSDFVKSSDPITLAAPPTGNSGLTPVSVPIPAGTEFTALVSPNPDGSFTPVPTYVDENGTVYALIDEEKTLIPVTINSSFSDVPANSWFAEYAKTASKLGIIVGYGESLFGPNDTVTNQQTVTMLMRTIGFNASYDSVLEDAAAKDIKYASGLSNTDHTSRADTAILIKDILATLGFDVALDEGEKAELLASFNDLEGLTGEGTLSIAVAIKYGILEGTYIGEDYSTMEPDTLLTRAQMATISTRLIEFLTKK